MTSELGRRARNALCLVCLIMLCACGQTGALVLPDAATPTGLPGADSDEESDQETEESTQ